VQIAQVQVNDTIYSLAEGQPLQIKVGDVIKVYFSFKANIPERMTVNIQAALYRYTFGVLNRTPEATTKGTMTLESTGGVVRDYSTDIDITIMSGINADIYGLLVELPAYNLQAKIDDCLEVPKKQGLLDMIGPLLVLGLMMGMMAMISPMMKEGFE